MVINYYLISIRNGHSGHTGHPLTLEKSFNKFTENVGIFEQFQNRRESTDKFI
jgi:hypothetical protein